MGSQETGRQGIPGTSSDWCVSRRSFPRRCRRPKLSLGCVLLLLAPCQGCPSAPCAAAEREREREKSVLTCSSTTLSFWLMLPLRRLWLNTLWSTRRRRNNGRLVMSSTRHSAMRRSTAVGQDACAGQAPNAQPRGHVCKDGPSQRHQLWSCLPCPACGPSNDPDVAIITCRS